jgi:branched-chain amino acid transport system substrate-binding protein
MHTGRLCARFSGALVLTALLAHPVVTQRASAWAVAAVPGVTADTITVGGIFAQTGPARLICGAIEQGAVQAVQDINARGGIYGRRLKFVVEDDGFDPSRSLGAMRKLVEKDGVFAVVGTCGSDTTLATLSYTEAHHVPVINPVAGDIADLGALQWTWVTEGQYQDDLVAMAKYAIQVRGARRIALVYREDAAARSYKDIVGAAVAKLGGQLVDAEPIVTGAQTSFAATITRLRQSNPDVVMVGIYLQDGALFFRDAQRLRYRPPGDFMLTYDLADPAFTALAGPWAIGATVSDFIDLSLGAPYMRNYLAAARLRPEQFSPYKWVDYNGYRIFGDMLRAAGPHLTRDSFRQAADARFLHHRGSFGPLFSFTPTHRFGITQYAMFRVEPTGFTQISGYINPNL